MTQLYRNSPLGVPPSLHWYQIPGSQPRRGPWDLALMVMLVLYQSSRPSVTPKSGAGCTALWLLRCRWRLGAVAEAVGAHYMLSEDFLETVVFGTPLLLNPKVNPNTHCGRHNRSVLPSGVALMQCSCSLNLGFTFGCYPRKAKEFPCPTDSFC